MLLPDTAVTVKTVIVVVEVIAPLVSVQLPFVSVTQLASPPVEKLPLTVAFATAAVLLTSRTVAVAFARHVLPFLLDVAVPVNELTATTVEGGSVAVPVASEYSSWFGDPVPTELSLSPVALATTNVPIARGEASGLASATRAETPATCGDAIEVPLMVLVALLLVCQAEVIPLPGAKMSTQEP